MAHSLLSYWNPTRGWHPGSGRFEGRSRKMRDPEVHDGPTLVPDSDELGDTTWDESAREEAQAAMNRRSDRRAEADDE